MYCVVFCKGPNAMRLRSPIVPAMYVTCWLRLALICDSWAESGGRAPEKELPGMAVMYRTNPATTSTNADRTEPKRNQAQRPRGKRFTCQLLASLVDTHPASFSKIKSFNLSFKLP